METKAVNELKRALPYFMQHKNVWASYDDETDTLYIHLRRPNTSSHTHTTEDNIIVRYEKEEIIGFTVLHASTR